MKTTKQLSLLFVLLVASMQAFSQVEFGAQLGLSASTQAEVGNLWKNNNLCCGLNAGVLARYQTNDWLAFKSSVLYKRKGAEIDELDQTYRLDYLQLPVKAEFSAALQQDKPARILFATGPYIATRLDAEYEHAGNKTDIKDDVHAMDLGWAFELGFQFPVAKQKFQLSLNYDMGLSDVYKNGDEIKNKNLSLNLGMFF